MNFDVVINLLNGGIEKRIFTGASLLVGKKDQDILRVLTGTVAGEGSAAIGSKTLFDLASLTKVLAVTPAMILIAAEIPEILDMPITTWFSEVVTNDKLSITPRHLSAHSSGLPAWRPYYLKFYAGSLNNGGLAEAILSESLDYEPGRDTIYSDLGFMLLGMLIERHSGASLDNFAVNRIYRPLGIAEHLTFRPAPERYGIVHTSPGDITAGAVHDLNCRAMGGVSGHAGLFGSIDAVGVLCREYLKSYCSEGFFPQSVFRTFAARANFTPESSRALGFDTPSAEASSSGTRFSLKSIGHTGFTGTSVWIDLNLGIFVVLLTNRVFCGESDPRIKSFRPAIHDCIMEALSEEEI